MSIGQQVGSSAGKAAVAGAVGYGLARVVYGSAQTIGNLAGSGYNLGMQVGAASAVGEFGTDLVSSFASSYLPGSLIGRVQDNAQMIAGAALMVGLSPQLVKKPGDLIKILGIMYVSDLAADMVFGQSYGNNSSDGGSSSGLF